MIYRLAIILSIFIPAAAIGLGFLMAVRYMEKFLLPVIIGCYVAGSVAMSAIGITASAAAGHPEWIGDIPTESVGWVSALLIAAAVICILPLILAMVLAVRDIEEQT